MPDEAQLKEQRKRIRHILKRWGRVKNYIEDKTEELNEFAQRIQELRELRGRVIGDGIRGSETSDPTAKTVVLITQLGERFRCAAEKIEESTRAELKFKEDTDKFIDSLDADERRVIFMRYQKDMSFVSIGQKMNYDSNYAKRLLQFATESLLKAGILKSIDNSK